MAGNEFPGFKKLDPTGGRDENYQPLPPSHPLDSLGEASDRVIADNNPKHTFKENLKSIPLPLKAAIGLLGLSFTSLMYTATPLPLHEYAQYAMLASFAGVFASAIVYIASYTRQTHKEMKTIKKQGKSRRNAPLN